MAGESWGESEHSEWVLLGWDFFIWTKYKPGNSHKPSTFVDKSQKIKKKQVCYLCYIIRYFLISFALAVQGNIGRHFCTALG